MATKVTINRAAIVSYFARDPVPKAALRTVAEGLKGAVHDAAPVGTSRQMGPFRGGAYSAKHGQFRRSLRVRAHRTWFRVESTDPFGHIVEYGSVNNPVYAPFRHALRGVTGAKAVIFSKGQHHDRAGGEFGEGGRGT